MKNTLTYLCLFLLVYNSFGQPKKTLNTKYDVDVNLEDKNQKISFIVGIGGSYIGNNLYQNPVVNVVNKYVILEEAQNYKTNISLGIAYTGSSLRLRNGIKVPYGLTFATFINPIALNQVSDSEQGFFNMVDFGVGLGWKFSGSMMIMGTVEFFNVRQPKEWFIEEYGKNNKQFLVENAPQISFDSSDDNIFKNQMATTIGFKICYTFDIIKSYIGQNGNSTDKTSTPAIETPEGDTSTTTTTNL
ncbi:hypothetical protein [Arenibacter troitsensis]|uniref:Uncharacterized protein n=1 Tax=Arenibacter troitsensis TaxID=188872 RepID=A0A1X7JAL2_9FLAO|nr:hypothetical protein [Arenibacter troitsensis]SMG24085.1 hypothetical protein SAMN03080602_01522 [Arenibacter troitsensis]